MLFAIAILVALLFSKNVYTASLGSLLHLLPDPEVRPDRCRTRRSICSSSWARSQRAPSPAAPIGDRFGRKPVIWFSILGAFPFALMLPYANLFWTGVLTVAIGLILASAFSAILVYAQELLPAASAWSPACSSASPLAWAAWEPRRWADRRSDQHRHGLPAVLVPAADRALDRVPAEYRATALLSEPPPSAQAALTALKKRST